MDAMTLNLGISTTPWHRHSSYDCYLSAQNCSSRRLCLIARSQLSSHHEYPDRNEEQLCRPPSGRRDFTAGIVSGLLCCNVLSFELASERPCFAKETSSAAPDYTITDKVYLEITKCPSISITSREGGQSSSEIQGAVSASVPSTLSTSTSSSSSAPMQSILGSTSSSSTASSSYYCNDGEVLGRIVIGLYGKQVPETVANFKAMCTGKAGSSYKGSLIHRIFAGQYIMAGKQGFSKEKGEVLPPSQLNRNMESIKSDAFKMNHMRPGTVSLCLSENDDEDQFKLDPDYRNVEFLITTGPGPAPQLDNKNIVFGTVIEGLNVVLAAATVPTYKPSERIRQFNELASFLGDERASNARSIWYRPLKALYISDCGEL
ncbi:hypothetical protein KP509_24G058000 [Ceratopteris richardii]|uniref:PPIase cyclophilin-type domain-containing protein n=1 Tax=Ceratopteris richardii TaxID=49495 RepID=A0A8T2RVD6_CERRI|nr:hypothetical protein KP509_24G058000 [Ceratopteris richardii]KAH7300353.1 hypothetical protein KP509_24G058000 [Ceratopteris richardii]